MKLFLKFKELKDPFYNKKIILDFYSYIGGKENQEEFAWSGFSQDLGNDSVYNYHSFKLNKENALSFNYDITKRKKVDKNHPIIIKYKKDKIRIHLIFANMYGNEIIMPTIEREIITNSSTSTINIPSNRFCIVKFYLDSYTNFRGMTYHMENNKCNITNTYCWEDNLIDGIPDVMINSLNEISLYEFNRSRYSFNNNYTLQYQYTYTDRYGNKDVRRLNDEYDGSLYTNETIMGKLNDKRLSSNMIPKSILHPFLVNLVDMNYIG